MKVFPLCLSDEGKYINHTHMVQNFVRMKVFPFCLSDEGKYINHTHMVQNFKRKGQNDLSDEGKYINHTHMVQKVRLIESISLKRESTFNNTYTWYHGTKYQV